MKCPVCGTDNPVLQIPPAQPAPTVAPADVTCKCGHFERVHYKFGRNNSCKVQDCDCKEFTPEKQPATPQGHGDVLTLLTYEELWNAVGANYFTEFVKPPEKYRRFLEALQYTFKAQDAKTRTLLAKAAQPHVQSPTVAEKCPVCLMTGFHAPTCPRDGREAQ